MKNAILGVIGAFLIIYTTVIGLGVYNRDTRYDEMEKVLSQVIKQTLENEFGKENSDLKQEALIEEIKYRMESDSKVEVEIYCMDLEKGIISVTVRESFVQINGKLRTCECTKTAIMDREKIEIWEEGSDE